MLSVCCCSLFRVAGKLTVSNNGHVTDVDGAARVCQYTVPSQYSSERMRLRVHQTADLLDGEFNHVGGVVWVSLVEKFYLKSPALSVVRQAL
jgi:hypothetical protein